MSRNRIDDWKSALIRSVGAGLEGYGFVVSPKDQAFYRAHETGRVCVHLSFIEHPEDVDVTADVAVRFDDVEELVNRHNALLTAKEKRDTFTMGAELGSIQGVGRKRWTVQSDSDIPIVSHEILMKVESVGLPYLSEFVDRRVALSALNDEAPESVLHSPFEVSRAMAACALTFLDESKGEAIRVGERKLAMLESSGSPGVARFAAFLDELRRA